MQRTIVISINSSWNILNFRRGLVRGLLADGHRVVALTPEDDAAPRLAEIGIEHVAVPIDSAGLSPAGDLRLLLAYVRALRAIAPAAFLAWTIKPNVYGSLAAHMLRIPVVNNVAGLGTAFLGRRWLRRLASTLYRLAFARSATVFFQNRDDCAMFVDAGLVRAGQAVLLPGSGIDLDRFAPAAGPDERGGTCIFLLVARVLRDKGVVEYVEAAQRLRAAGRPLRFQLLGPLGSENRTAIPRETVDRWVADGIVEYLGGADDVRPFVAAADCIVLPSYREGLPRTLLEASAMARPLVATDVPGCRDVVMPGINGYLCPPRDAGALADAMARIADLPAAARREMGRAGRRMVEDRFDEAIVVDRYRAALTDALG